MSPNTTPIAETNSAPKVERAWEGRGGFAGSISHYVRGAVSNAADDNPNGWGLPEGTLQPPGAAKRSAPLVVTRPMRGKM